MNTVLNDPETGGCIFTCELCGESVKVNRIEETDNVIDRMLQCQSARVSILFMQVHLDGNCVSGRVTL